MTARERRRLRRIHERAAAGFAEAGFVHERTRQGLLTRLQWAALQPRVVLDLGAGNGAAAEILRSRYPDARILAIDHAVNMLAGTRQPGAARVCAEATGLPLPDAQADLVFCNLMLACCRDPVPVLAETRRVLAPRGLFGFATLGQESFRELRAAWDGLDRFVHWPPHPDMHALGSLLQAAGFVETVLDSETISVTYQNFDRLAADLRGAGSSNHSNQRNPGLTGRRAHQTLVDATHRLKGADGRFTVTVQVLYGLTWAGTAHGTGAGEEISVPLSRLVDRGREPGRE